MIFHFSQLFLYLTVADTGAIVGNEQERGRI